MIVDDIEIEKENEILEKYAELRAELNRFIISIGGINNEFKSAMIEELINTISLVNFPATYDREDLED